jgi:thioredoxin 1
MKQFLYISAAWCGPCRMLGPTMNQLQQEGYSVRKVDADTESNIVQQYGVRNIPTVILLNNGQEVARQVGNSPKSTYINMWNNS